MPTKEVEVRFKATSDDAALQQFLSSMKGVNVHLGETGKATKETESAMGSLFEKIAVWVASLAILQKAWAGLKALVSAGLDEQRETAQFERSMRAFTSATAEQTKSLMEWIEATAIVYGLSHDKLIPAFEHLLALTGDLGGAQTLLSAALRGAKATGDDLDTVLNTMVRGSLSNAIRATGAESGYAAKLKELMNHGYSAKEAILKLDEQFKQTATTQDNTAKEIDRVNEKWAQSKEAVGLLLTQLVDKLAPAFPFIGGVIASFVITLKGAWASLMQGRALVTGFAESAVAAAKGDFGGAAKILAEVKSEYAKIGAAWVKDSDKTFAEFMDLWDNAAAMAKKRALDMNTSLASALGLIKGQQEGKKPKEDPLTEFLSSQETELNKSMAEQQEIIDKWLEERRKAYLKNSESITDIISKQLTKEGKLATEEQKKELRLQALERSIIHRSEIQELQEKKKEVQQELALAKAGTDEEIRLRQMLGVVDAQITFSTTDLKKQKLYEMLGAAEGAAGKTIGLTTAMAQADAIAAAISAARDAEPWYMKIVAAGTILAYTMSLFNTIKGIAGGGGGGTPRAAKGGLVTAPNFVFVGEEGPELIIPAHVTKFLMRNADNQQKNETHNVTNHSSRYAPTIYYSPTNLFGAEKDNGLRKVAKMLAPAQRYNDRRQIKPKPRFSKATGRGL